MRGFLRIAGAGNLDIKTEDFNGIDIAEVKKTQMEELRRVNAGNNNSAPFSIPADLNIAGSRYYQAPQPARSSASSAHPLSRSPFTLLAFEIDNSAQTTAQTTDEYQKQPSSNY